MSIHPLQTSAWVDQQFQLRGVPFVWDKAKAANNLKKHEVSFQQAAEAFFDPFLRMVGASPDESRDAIIGFDSNGRMLFVVHIELEDDGGYRIISARKATAEERKVYERS